MSTDFQTSTAYARALLLLQQGRPADAERELRQLLAEQPQHAMAHAMLARCLTEQDRLDEAQENAKQAIGLAPDESMTHYVLSLVYFARNRLEEAGEAIVEAIRLDPDDPDLQAMLAQILVQERRWADAKLVSERGLAIDPEHIGCTNLRAIALVHLGQRDQATATIDAALQREPDNSLTHANQGWNLLHQNQHVRAMEHFRESLRLDPNSEWARAGIVEAMKARNVLYRLMLAYFLFMSRMSGQVQWAIILGLWILTRTLDRLADANPALAPYLRPVVYVYVIFALLTWLSPHLFNLLLRLSRFGRHALSVDQRRSSNVVGAMLGLTSLALLGGWISDSGDLFIFGLCMLGLLMPLAGAFQTPRGWPRSIMYGVSAVLGFIAVSLLVLTINRTEIDSAVSQLWNALLWTFIIGVVGSQFLANVLSQQQVRR